MTPTAPDTTSQNEQQISNLSHLIALRLTCLQMKADAEAKDEVAHRKNRSDGLYAEFSFLTSYLEGEVFSADAIQGLTYALETMREVINKHGRTLIEGEIVIRSATSEGDASPEMRMEIINQLIAEEPEYSPYQSVLVDMLHEAHFQ